jgi:hypothetical protein
MQQKTTEIVYVTCLQGVLFDTDEIYVTYYLHKTFYISKERERARACVGKG